MKNAKKKPYSEMTIGELEALAEQGYANTQFGLASRYYNGEGVEKNHAKAMEWYKKAAEQKELFAFNNLGYCYEHGNGVVKDLAKALEWAIKAADNGDEEARNTVLEIQQKMSEKALCS